MARLPVRRGSLRPAALMWFLWGAVCFSRSAAEGALPKVPDGFVIEKVASSPLVKHPMMAGFDDRGRLFVAASSGKNLKAKGLLKDPPNFIRMLEDTDDDGCFEASTVFADNMTLPMGALWYRGALYVASPPSIWRLEDTDGDGKADRREEIVNTFGFSGNAASVHGCFLGPNGRLYWCDGRHGHEFVDEEGRLVSQGKAARIFSCRPDGSDVRTFCGGGMDNPVEVDFTAEGEMLGSVNIFHSRPRQDCLVHWVEGGVYPRRDQQDCIAEFNSTGDLLPAISKLGHVAVSGMTRYRSCQFGEQYQGNLFVTLFNTHKVVRSVVERSGSSFRTRNGDFLISKNHDFHPTDVLEDADGSLLVIDTGGWFRIGCPESQVAKPEIHGAIYRIRREGATPPENPRGLRIDFTNRQPRKLVSLLDDARPAVREKAIDHLARRGSAAVAALSRIVGGPSTVPSRRNAVWALSRIESEAAQAAIRQALDDASSSVRLAATRSLGTVGDHLAAEPLCRLVIDDTPAVRRQAATALGGVAQQGLGEEARRQAVDALFASLEHDPVDRFLEHAVIYALICIAAQEATASWLNHSNPELRRAALIALDRMDGGNLTRRMVVPLLDTGDKRLQNEALSVIARHDGWAEETLRRLRKWLRQSQPTDKRRATLRGFLLAQSRDPAIQAFIAESLRRPELSKPWRLLLLEVLGRADVQQFPDRWITPLRRSLEDDDLPIRLQAIRAVDAHGLRQFDELLRPLAHQSSQPDSLRLEVLGTLAPRMENVSESLLHFLLNQLDGEVPALQRLSAARILAEIPLTKSQFLCLAERIPEAGPLTVPVLVRSFSRTDAEAVGSALLAALKKTPALASLAPKELRSIFQGYPPSIHRKSRALLERLGSDGTDRQKKLAQLASLTTGGNPKTGREIFFSKKAACSNCHRIDGRGNQLGPELTTIGQRRNGRDLLEAVVLPSGSFARGYRPYTVLTKQGKVVSGVINRRTAETITLRTAELAEIRLAHDEIETIRQSDTSIMPKGLEKQLTRDELRHLLAFLKQCR